MNHYYVRIKNSDHAEFLNYLARCNLQGRMISFDFQTYMFAIDMEDSDATALTLSINIVGLTKFDNLSPRKPL